MQIKELSDSALFSELKVLVSKERTVLTDILRYLREVECRGLFLARGYSSLFVFCIEELGYSEAESHLRIQAMRLVKAVPEVEAHLNEGKLSLTVAAEAQGCFRREEKADRPLEASQKLAIVEELFDTTSRQAERKLASHFPEKILPKEKTRALTEEITRIEFNASRALIEKLEKLKNLLAHKNFEGRTDRLIEELADIALTKLEPKEQRKPLGAPQVKRTRFLRADVKRAVWKRDQGRCQFQDIQTGKTCGNKHGLQIDHIEEFSSGGGNEISNLRLLCGPHNRWRSARSEM